MTRTKITHAAAFLLGVLLTVFFANHPGHGSSLDESIQRMKGRTWVVIGHDPEMESMGKRHWGTRGWRGEAAENWITVTYPTAAEAKAAVHKLYNQH